MIGICGVLAILLLAYLSSVAFREVRQECTVIFDAIMLTILFSAIFPLLLLVLFEDKGRGIIKSDINRIKKLFSNFFEKQLEKAMKEEVRESERISRLMERKMNRTITKFFEPINHRKIKTVTKRVYKLCTFFDGSEHREELTRYSSPFYVELLDDFYAETGQFSRRLRVGDTNTHAKTLPLGHIRTYEALQYDSTKSGEIPPKEKVLEGIFAGLSASRSGFSISDGKIKAITEISVDIVETEEEIEICDYIVRGREE